MEITRSQRDDYLELGIEGRLDGYWAQHLETTVADVMREGTHAVRVNLSKAGYISSAGIGVLVRLYKQFQAVNGSFAVVEPSKPVQIILKAVGLEAILLGGGGTAPAPPVVQEDEGPQLQEVGGGVFAIHRIEPGAALSCKAMGHPERLASAGFSAGDCQTLDVQQNLMALGLGAFGEGFDECRNSFGEFLTVSGGAACQPTDGTNTPDYMLGSDTFAPHLSTLYGLCCTGSFGTLVRFESATGNDPLPLSLIVETCLKIAGAPSAGVVVVGESAGLMGASLKRPPVEAGRLFAYPDVRKWLSFSPERSFPHALALIAGVVSSEAPEPLRPFLRPLAKRASALGHLHAAVFGYRPLQKGRIPMESTVRGLFDSGGLLGVMHLLADDREISGGGETELSRGACWVSPIGSVA